MQVRALMEAAVERSAAGGHPVVEIMIPLTVNRAEMAEARRWVESALDEVAAQQVTGKGGRARGRAAARGAKAARGGRIDVLIGTMVETPRAALQAGEIAEVAEFFSFGTNDLTQLTFGFSRDDVEGRMMSAYLEQGLLARNPFDTVDAIGVGELVRLGVERGRATRPDLKIGVCGEHGGDAESIAVFAAAGLDYVSCSPFRVPVARLAAAQALVASGAAVVPPAGSAASPASGVARRRSGGSAAGGRAAATSRTARTTTTGTTAARTTTTGTTAARTTAARTTAARKSAARTTAARKTAVRKAAPGTATAGTAPSRAAGAGRVAAGGSGRSGRR